jgi:ABC-type polysaccharide/polyol phosphate export permease
MFPVESLPHPLAVLAHAVPFTFAIDAMRGALLEGRSLTSLSSSVTALAIYGFVLLPLSLAGLSLSLKRARQCGTLSFY